MLLLHSVSNIFIYTSWAHWQASDDVPLTFETATVDQLLLRVLQLELRRLSTYRPPPPPPTVLQAQKAFALFIQRSSSTSRSPSRRPWWYTCRYAEKLYMRSKIVFRQVAQVLVPIPAVSATSGSCDDWQARLEFHMCRFAAFTTKGVVSIKSIFGVFPKSCY